MISSILNYVSLTISKKSSYNFEQKLQNTTESHCLDLGTGHQARSIW